MNVGSDRSTWVQTLLTCAPVSIPECLMVLVVDYMLTLFPSFGPWKQTTFHSPDGSQGISFQWVNDRFVIQRTKNCFSGWEMTDHPSKVFIRRGTYDQTRRHFKQQGLHRIYVKENVLFPSDDETLYLFPNMVDCIQCFVDSRRLLFGSDWNTDCVYVCPPGYESMPVQCVKLQFPSKFAWTQWGIVPDFIFVVYPVTRILRIYQLPSYQEFHRWFALSSDGMKIIVDMEKRESTSFLLGSMLGLGNSERAPCLLLKEDECVFWSKQTHKLYTAQMQISISPQKKKRKKEDFL